jgi:hypothetical protein
MSASPNLLGYLVGCLTVSCTCAHILNDSVNLEVVHN